MLTKRFTALALALAFLFSAISSGVTFAKNDDEDNGGKVVDLACMQTAVGTRDTAIIAGLDAYYASVKSALEKRKTDLTAAWGLTDEGARKEAIKAAWGAFKNSVKDAKKTFKKARKDAWKKFKEDRKACGGSGEDGGGEGADAKL